MKGVIIFGGTGFIGFHYAVYCLENNLVDSVVLADIRDIDFDRVTDKFKLYYDQGAIKFINCDVRRKIEIDFGFDIDFIVNLAAIHTTPGHETNEYYETNINGAINITAFAEMLGVKQIVFTSSISVYGPDEALKDEKSDLLPKSAYGFSKMLAENIHKSWFDRGSNHKLVIVRPAVVFGPGERGNFTRLATLMRKGFFIYTGRKDTIKSCIYVADLITLIEAARTSNEKLELLNGAYQERYTLENIIDAFKDVYFPNVKLYMLPKALVLAAAHILKALNFLNIGIHPERVIKLLVSTNIFPGWVESNHLKLSGNLETALKRWHDETGGRFS
jgi:nucleoside-diphosphate-sugar epimerase